MPLIEDKQQQVAFARAIGQGELEPESADFGDVLQSAFRLDNTFGSLIAQESGLPDSVVNSESFNPWEHMTDDEKTNTAFVEHAALADDEVELNAVRKQAARERQDRKLLEENGANSFLAGLVAGVLDPINLIPVGGTAYKTYRTGSSILKSAVATGSVATGSQALVEAALHQTQLERTYGESAVNLTGAALLGGVIGAIPPALKNVFGKGSPVAREVEESLDPEPVLARGGNSVLSEVQRFGIDEDKIKSSLLEQARSELSAMAKTRLTRGDRKALNEQLKSLDFELEKVEAPTQAEINELADTLKAEGTGARQAKTEAARIAQERVNNTKAEIDQKITDIKTRIETNQAAQEAFGDLTRIDQGILPDKYNLLFEEIKNKRLAKAREAAPTKEAATMPESDDFTTVTEDLPTGGTGSVGAAMVDSEIQVQNKIAKALTKALGFDPLSRSLTSELNDTRLLAAQLAENPIAMENKTGNYVADSVESRIKIKDGLYFEAIESHDNIFREYRKAGGHLKRKDFNELVSREMRNPSTTDTHIKSAAEAWRNSLFEPLKKELIDTGLLPEDIEVSTATNYLNRVWNKEKIRSNLDRFVGKVSTWLKEQEGRAQELSDEELESLAREIATRITGTPDGRLPYDYKIGENSNKAKGGGVGPKGFKGPLKERSFNIPDELVEEFLENDVELLGSRYLKGLAADIELVKRFGDINMEAEIKEISDNWDIKIQHASKTDPKLARKYAKQKDQDIESIAAMRDRIRGVYGQVDPDNFWVRAGRTARDLNYLRFMGGVVASSIPDVARTVMAHGIGKVFNTGLKPLIKHNKSFKLAAHEAKRYGVGVDVLMGGRSEIIADIADYSQGGTVFERGVRSMANSFGKVNLMDYWTAGIKQLHAVVAQTEIADTLTSGKFDKRLQQLGIDEADGQNIARELRKYGKKMDGVWVANTRDWESQELAQIWGAALRKESDRVIVVPGQEKPLFMSNELGKTILQFRSFMFSATQRMFIAGIQGQDAHYIQGILGLTSLGMLAYAFKQWDADRPISDDPAVWITEGIDRSGVTGIIMEMNNTVEKVTNNNFGLRPLLGVSTPSSRFASRSQAEAWLGPTFGSLLSTGMKVMGGASDGDLAESDIRAIRRLMPYQNLLIFRQGIDKLEESLK